MNRVKIVLTAFLLLTFVGTDCYCSRDEVSSPRIGEPSRVQHESLFYTPNTQKQEIEDAGSSYEDSGTEVDSGSHSGRDSGVSNSDSGLLVDSGNQVDCGTIGIDGGLVGDEDSDSDNDSDSDSDSDSEHHGHGHH